MARIPCPELLRSDPVILQNLLVRVEDATLARFAAVAGKKITFHLLENTSQRRRVRISRSVEAWRERVEEGGDLAAQRQLVYYLSYLFLYEQVKKYI